MVMIKNSLYISVVLFIVSLLNGCSGGEADYNLEDVNPIYHGNFIDEAVEGVEYVRSNGENDVTGRGGQFNYKRGELITFYVGALTLGTSVGSSVLTPRELAHGSQVIEDNIVSNRVRLLLALDSDPKIGIQVSSTMRQKAKSWENSIDYNQSEVDFSTEVEQVTNGDISGAALPSKDVADTHFRKTLTCAYSGAYQGAWDVENSNETSGYVGVMIQANSTVVLIGEREIDAQTRSITYVVGQHDVNEKAYTFNPDVYYYFDSTANNGDGSLVSVTNDINISGNGISQAYDHIKGSFFDGSKTGSYEVRRADASSNAAYRFTGFGWNNAGGLPIGMVFMDIDPDGKVSGLIHYIPDTSIQPHLHGSVDFMTGDVNITVDAPDQNILPPLSKVNGTINFNDTSTPSSLTWNTLDDSPLGSVQLDGCQLQAID